MKTENIRNLASATLLQAIKDYINGEDKQKKSVLKDLRSSWMEYFTDGMSNIVADKLETDLDTISKRMHLLPDDK